MTDASIPQTTKEVITKIEAVVVQAHLQIDHEQIAFYYPDHSPRESDSHYSLFNKARKRILAAGVGCWICGATEQLELHHSEVEFAAAGGVDIARFSELFPEYHITCEEDFLSWVEGEGNLLVLCARCHRSPFAGIHHCPYPNWKLQRFWRKDLPAPVQDAKAALLTVTQTTMTETSPTTTETKP